MIDQVRPSQLDDWLSRHAGQRPVLLDVREPMELQVARTAPDDRYEFLHLPMHTVPARLNELDPQRPVACLCHHGGRSMQVAMFLAHHGFESVANVAGGIDAWSIERDPTVSRY